jgi:hypothetical protein
VWEEKLPLMLWDAEQEEKECDSRETEQSQIFILISHRVQGLRATSTLDSRRDSCLPISRELGRIYSRPALHLRSHEYCCLWRGALDNNLHASYIERGGTA